MAWLRRKKVYDRSRILSQAGRARNRGKARKAIALYQEVLAHEPKNTDLHRRIAPLLASTKQAAESWKSYCAAVDGLTSKGFLDQAVGVLREATGCLQRERAVWERLADVEIERGRPIDACKSLVDGSRRFRSRRDLPEAIRLLVRARKLAPTDFTANYELAGLLARSGSRDRARGILAELARTTRGSQLRRVRGRQLRLSPSPATLWRWLRAALSGR